MFTLSGLREGLARGLVCLHSPPLLGRKTSSAKSRDSITSKVIENTRLQVLLFGHLRKRGGRGSYQFATNTRRSFSEGGSPLFPLHTKTTLACPLFPLHTQKQGGCRPLENVGAPTFFIFPLTFHTFLPFAGQEHHRGKEEKSWHKSQRYIGESGYAAEASKAWPWARTWSGTRRSSRMRWNQERSFRP